MFKAIGVGVAGVLVRSLAGTRENRDHHYIMQHGNHISRVRF